MVHRRAFLALAALVLAGTAVAPSLVGSGLPRAAIETASATPAVLPATGGEVTVEAEVAYAQTCWTRASGPVHVDVPPAVPCGGGHFVAILPVANNNGRKPAAIVIAVHASPSARVRHLRVEVGGRVGPQSRS